LTHREKSCSCRKGSPHGCLQGRRGHDEHALPIDVGSPVDDLAGQVRLPEADLVGDEHAAVLVQEPLHPHNPVGLEPGQVQTGLDVRVLVVQVRSVQLPQHPQVDEPWVVWIPQPPVQRGQIVRIAHCPEVFEPLVHLGGSMSTPTRSEVQLGIQRQACVGHVRGAGDRGLGRRVLHQVCLAMEESTGEPPNLHPCRPVRVEMTQPLHHSSRVRVWLSCEPHGVPFHGEPIVVLLDRSADSRVHRRVMGADGSDRALLRLCPEQQPDPRCPLQFVSKEREPTRVDVCRRDGNGRRAHLVLPQQPEELVHPVRHADRGLAREVIGREVRQLRHACPFQRA
jgi:hypothetical protein